MRILIVAATEAEIGGLRSEVGGRKSEVGSRKSEVGSRKSEVGGRKSEVGDRKSGVGDRKSGVGSQTSEVGSRKSELFKSEIGNPKSEILITGVGMVATAFALGRHLANNHYDLAINLGIAGSFDRNIALGDILEITADTFAESGTEDDNDFLSIEKLGFGESTYYPSEHSSNFYNLSNSFNLKSANAITVNTVHGNEASIQKITDRLNPQLESMEGAAFFYACKQMGVPCLQIRAVSNYVETRNRDNWKIGLAIKNLNTFAVDFLNVAGSFML